MSEPTRDPEELSEDPALERALDALASEPAAAEFKADLRARFLSGDFEQEAPDEAASAPQPTPVQRRGPRALEAPSSSRRWPMWLGLAAAALAAFFLIRGEQDSGPHWEVLDASFGELVYVGGRQVSPEWESDLEDALRAGGQVRTSDSSGLHLQFGEDLALFIGPDSTVTLPAGPSGKEAPRFDLKADAGHLSIATGPKFPGSDLQVFTPDTWVQVVGTAFAVDVDDKGTCVCCNEGSVKVRVMADLEAEPHQVQAGHVGFVHPDGAWATAAETMSEHVGVLDALGRIW